MGAVMDDDEGSDYYEDDDNDDDDDSIVVHEDDEETGECAWVLEAYSLHCPTSQTQTQTRRSASP